MTAAELNNLLSGYRALELSRPFPARFQGEDAITTAPLYPTQQIRMLRGYPLTSQGIEILNTGQPLNRRFVDDIEADGVYYVANRLGAVVRFEIKGEKAYLCANYGEYLSTAQLRSRRLKQKTALLFSEGEVGKARWK